MFQSTPGFYAGRYRHTPQTPLSRSSFNPLPAFMPGDTCVLYYLRASVDVSIHSRLLCREILDRRSAYYGYNLFQSTPGFYAGRYWSASATTINLVVSIPSRLLCREIPSHSTVPAPAVAFQSTPGFYAGRYVVFWIDS